MAQCADVAWSACLGKSMAKIVAMVILVCGFNAPPMAARRSIDRHRSESKSTLSCGPNSDDLGDRCRCRQGFQCVVPGVSNECLTRGNMFIGWGVRVASDLEYVPGFCMNEYDAPCECQAVLAFADTLPDEVAMEIDAPNEETAEFWGRYFNRGTPGPSQARPEARNSNIDVVPSLRPIEVDEDFVKARLSCLPSSLRDEIISSITCPISLNLMRDPVVAADGNTYDRESIMRAFSAKAPGQPIRGISGDISSRTVTENLNVRRILAEFERLWNAEKESKASEK
eukprot:TRINITY_DN4533_c0_g5_i1.p1 TRINITY_DN4533_c0_g5~~TRINITY_DN4533_c0_g5_i1.p1  ORF type:complete len:300 (-),score=27.06 TRINITY_DN4533_c0_g5_i1:117-968(-)